MAGELTVARALAPRRIEPKKPTDRDALLGMLERAGASFVIDCGRDTVQVLGDPRVVRGVATTFWFTHSDGALRAVSLDTVKDL